MQAVTGALGIAGVVENLDGGGGAELCPVLQYRYDFLVRSYFDELGTLIFSAAGADDGIAVREAGCGLRVAVPVLRRNVLLGQLPDGLLLGVNFAGEDIVFVGNEGVSVLESDGCPGTLDVIAPDLLEVLVVLDDAVHLE